MAETKKQVTKAELEELFSKVSWLTSTPGENIAHHLEAHPGATEEEAIQVIYDDVLKMLSHSDTCD